MYFHELTSHDVDDLRPGRDIQVVLYAVLLFLITGFCQEQVLRETGRQQVLLGLFFVEDFRSEEEFAFEELLVDFGIL
jgi:hypothetical protein